MSKIPTRFNIIVFLPKKTTKQLRMTLFDLPKRGEKIRNFKGFQHLRVQLEYREGNRLRPVRIEFKEHGTQYYQPKKFIQLLRHAKNIYLVEDEKKSLEDLGRMLEDYQINYNTIEICRLCMLDNKITVLQKNDRYYRSQAVTFPMCLQCAMKEIGDESAFRGFKPNRKFLNRIEGLLKKKFQHNVNKILKMFEPGFDASKNPEFTLYDTIEAKDSAKIEYPIKSYNIPQEFLEILKKERITYLMSIQNLAMKNGLLRNESLLISAPTGTGKTLVGELAGISNLFRKDGGKFLYLANLVALVNQKHENFNHRYRQFNVAIRVGMSKIDIGDEDLVIVDEDIQDADIICASYEAFDFLLRQGKEEVELLGKISTIVIDEIQTLEDEERGPILAGLIAKTFILFPEAQIIGLSATIGNAQEVGKMLHLKPIDYYDRPVPLERHLVLCKSEYEKIFNIIRLVRHESKQVSKFGYNGSTLIFTNARWRCEFLADLLRERGISAVAYHSGLTYFNRKLIEVDFDKGLIQAICTTFALGAGFDTPCSQVIFESCLMGIEVLTPNMFLNMSGRAGRFRRQERGKIVLLVEIGKNYHRTNKTEDQIALDLLESDTENLILDYSPDLIQSQVLAAIAAGIDTKIEEFYDYLVGAREDLSLLLKGLKKHKLIELKQNKYQVTTLGRAIALSFFSVEAGIMIAREITRREDPLTIALRLEFFNNVYITDEIKKIFLEELKIKLPNKFITGRIIGIAASVVKFKRRLRKFSWLAKSIALWQKVFFSCHCGNAPHCDCPLLTINRKLIQLRIEKRLTPKMISQFMERKFNLKVYAGDLLRFYDNLIHRLQGIQRIVRVLGKYEVFDDITALIRKIEKPSRVIREIS